MRAAVFVWCLFDLMRLRDSCAAGTIHYRRSIYETKFHFIPEYVRRNESSLRDMNRLCRELPQAALIDWRCQSLTKMKFTLNIGIILSLGDQIFYKHDIKPLVLYALDYVGQRGRGVFSAVVHQNYRAVFDL